MLAVKGGAMKNGNELRSKFRTILQLVPVKRTLEAFDFDLRLFP